MLPRCLSACMRGYFVVWSSPVLHRSVFPHSHTLSPACSLSAPVGLFPPFFPFRDRSRSSFRGTALFAPHKLPLETSIFAGCALSKSDRSTKLFLIPIHSRTFYSSGNHEIGPFGSTGVSYCSDFSTAPASRCDKKDLTLNAEAAHLFNAHSDQQAFWTCCIRNLVGQDGHKPRQDAAGQTRDDANFQINPHGAERGAP